MVTLAHFPGSVHFDLLPGGVRMWGSFRFHEWTVKLVLVALIFFLPSTLHAQIDTGSIVGVVKDPSGAVITGATVTLKNSATGVTRVVTTNQDGGYQFAAVTPGVYSVQASATSFESAITSNIQMDVQSRPA